MNQDELDLALAHLIAKDPVIAEVINSVPKIEIIPKRNYFVSICEAIVSQQLSVKAADTIWNRFVQLFPANEITPVNVVNTDQELMRGCGISHQKISYIKDLALKTLDSGILFEQFEIMTDEEIITELTKVKGIGRWTAEMFLMFTMNRPDIFSYGDLGIRKSIQKLYKMKKEPTQKRAEQIAKKWRPYRTVACRYLWKSLELK